MFVSSPSSRLRSPRALATLAMLALSMLCAACAAPTPAVPTATTGSQSAAPATSGTADSTWSAVEAAGKKDGKLVIYSALGPGNPGVTALLADFKARYGIDTQIVELRSSEMIARMTAEQDAGKFLGDILFTSIDTVSDLESTRFNPPPPLPNTSRLVAPYDQNLREFPQVLPFHTGYFTLLINTDLVPPAVEPKSWKDLLDPRWKGKILSDAMSPSGGGNVWFHVTYLKFGVEYHQQLVQQQLTFSRDSIANERRVETGEFAMYIPFNYYRVPSLQGPVKAVIPEEGVPYNLVIDGRLAQAPHPDAAQVFMNYTLSPEAQKILVDNYQGSVTGDGAANLPLLGRRDTPRTLELQQEAMKIYGQ